MYLRLWDRIRRRNGFVSTGSSSRTFPLHPRLQQQAYILLKTSSQGTAPISPIEHLRGFPNQAITLPSKPSCVDLMSLITLASIDRPGMVVGCFNAESAIARPGIYSILVEFVFWARTSKDNLQGLGPNNSNSTPRVQGLLSSRVNPESREGRLMIKIFLPE